MKVVFINKSDSLGGAAVVTLRLVQALRQLDVDARMLVTHKATDFDYVATAGSPGEIKRAFLLDRLPLLAFNGFSRRTLFQIDAGRAGLPLWRHPWVRQADVVGLGWINQGVLSLKGIGRIAELGKPLVWTMHDMWSMTGVCHHAHACTGYMERCGNCPLLGAASAENDLSRRVWKRKSNLYDRVGIQFVAVSHWLAGKARESSLLGAENVEVIPNAFPSTLPDRLPAPAAKPSGRILMVAARLDDSVKGLPLLVEAAKALVRIAPEKASGLQFDLVGELRDPSILASMPLPYSTHGLIDDRQQLTYLYSNASAVISPSLFETLPGTLIEAQDLGRIPVAFDRGGQRDIIDHLKTGYLCQWHDNPEAAGEELARGILWALEHCSDPDMARRMHQSVATHFGAKSVAERYIALFNRIN